MRNIQFSKKAQKYIKSLVAKHQKQIAQHIVLLQKDPNSQNTKKLQGHALYRIRSGDYRIIYSYDNDTVFILVIGKRNDAEVYKKLK